MKKKEAAIRIGMIFTGGRIGMFLFVIAGLALVDWLVTGVTFRGPPAIIKLILYGDLYGRSYPPLPSGLMLLPCPGNGFAFFCGPWALSLIFLFSSAVGIGLYVNVKRERSLRLAQGWGGSLDRRRLFVYLSLLASALLSFAFIWGWGQFLRIPGPVPGVTPLYQLVAPFMHPLFILVSIAAARHLRRSHQDGYKST